MATVEALAPLRPEWVPNSASIHCMRCRTPFSFTLRRHHCRACGELFCSGCCGTWVTLPRGFGYKSPQRVCKKCENSLKREQQEEDETKQHIESIMLAAQFYLRDKPYQFVGSLPDIGRLKPPTKSFFEVSGTETREPLLMTCVWIRNNKLIISPAARDCFESLITSIKHPYILPTLQAGFSIDKGVSMTIRPFSRDGSLRDQLYKVTPKTSFYQKYGTGRTSTILNIKTTALYGRQILEALSFLRSIRFPLPQLHASNVIFYQNKCCLTDLESSILGIQPLYLQHMNKFTSPEVICFGHILFQMCAGFPLGRLSYQDHANKLPQPVLEILQKIFTTSPPAVTIDGLLKDPFFAGVKIGEDMNAPRQECQLDKWQKALIKRARDNIKRMIERQCDGTLVDGEFKDDSPSFEVEPVKSPHLKKEALRMSSVDALELNYEEGPTSNNPNDPLNPENRKKAALRSKMIQKQIKRRTMLLEKQQTPKTDKSATLSGLVSPRKELEQPKPSGDERTKRATRTANYGQMSSSTSSIRTRPTSPKAEAPRSPPPPTSPAVAPPPPAGPPPPPPPSVSQLPPPQTGRNALLGSIRDPTNGLKRLKKVS